MSLPRLLTWERKSTRLWVAERDSRRFRILREAHGGIGGVAVIEVDRLHRQVRKEYAKGFPAAANVAEGWMREGQDHGPRG